MLIHKYKLLLSKGRLKEYVIAGCEMLAFYFRDIYNKPEVKGMHGWMGLGWGGGRCGLRPHELNTVDLEIFVL